MPDESLLPEQAFDATLIVDAVNSGYGSAQVLFGVSLAVSPGEIVAMLGPNGAGKSTFARTVVGLLRPFGGSVRIGRQDLTGLRPDIVLKHGVAMVPEGRQLLTGLTVEDNLRLAGRLSADVDRRLSQVLEYFPQLKSKLGNWGSDLSGGQQQLVAIGRALMSSPKFIILDEPSLGLAPKTQGEVAEVIDEIRRVDGTGLLLVEQNLGLAARLADRALIMRRGEVQSELKGAALHDSEQLFAAYVE